MAIENVTWPKLTGITIPFKNVRRDLLLIDELWIPVSTTDYSDGHYLRLLNDVVKVLRRQDDIRFLESKGLVRVVDIVEKDFFEASSDDSYAFLSWTFAAVGSAFYGAVEKTGADLSTTVASALNYMVRLHGFPLPTEVERAIAAGLNDGSIGRSFLASLASMLNDSASRVACAHQRQKHGVESVALIPASAQEGLEQISDMLLKYLPTVNPAALPHELSTMPLVDSLQQSLLNVFPVETHSHMRANLDKFLRQPQRPRQSVLAITLKQFPVPDDSIPLEQFVEFCQDEDTRRKLARLRFWMRTTARAERPALEIEQEIQESLFEYEERMKLHKMKWSHGTWRALLTTSAEVIDNALRLRFKPVVDLIFGFAEKRVQLLEAEDAAPGKEVAYISAVREAFPLGSKS